MESIRDFAGYILAAAIAIIAWFSRRDFSRYDDGLERIGELEKTSVTHAQLERIMERNDARTAAMHAQNLEHLQRIEDRMETNKDELRDELHALALEVAAK